MALSSRLQASTSKLREAGEFQLAQMAETAPSQICSGTTSSTGLQSVALVGFMGAGKTTVGRALAARLGWRFQDLDDLIVQRENRSVERIFHESGESYFRQLENRVLREVTAQDSSFRLILALGGGAFVDAGNQDWLREAKVATVFLDASGEELFQRCHEPGVVRPLRQDIAQFNELYERRRPEYLKSSLHIQTAGTEVAAVADKIIGELKLLASPGATE
jgi:shikimate kinase